MLRSRQPEETLLHKTCRKASEAIVKERKEGGETGEGWKRFRYRFGFAKESFAIVKISSKSNQLLWILFKKLLRNWIGIIFNKTNWMKSSTKSCHFSIEDCLLENWMLFFVYFLFLFFFIFSLFFDKHQHKNQWSEIHWAKSKRNERNCKKYYDFFPRSATIMVLLSIETKFYVHESTDWMRKCRRRRKKAILKKKNVPFLLFENVSVALLDVKPLQFERIE